MRRKVRRHPPTDSIPARVVEKVTTRIERAEDGCHLTLQGLSAQGYGQVGWTGDGVSYQGLTHRVVYIAARGPIPVGYDVHHKCFNRRCVNIEHLEAMPASENRRRTKGDDWLLGQCKFGHSNDYMIDVSGRKRCGPCLEAYQAGYRAGRKEEKLSADTGQGSSPERRGG